jgi:multidrug efflux pump subunit AcrB
LAPRDCLILLSGFQQQMAGDLSSRLHLLRSVSNPEPPQLSDLPPGLVSRFVGKNNRHLLKIYGRGNIWDMADLEEFVVDVKGVDAAATGQPLQTYHASRHMQRSYILAAAYALFAVSLVLLLDFHTSRYVLLALLPIGLGLLLSVSQQGVVLTVGCIVVAVTVVVLLDFRSLLCTVLALLPMSLGLAQLFGVMGWLNIPLNPANMIVLPLILGIGVDDGVHVVHDFLRQRGRYRLSASTATAVLITSLTTMMGFGSLMLAGHRGLQSLGRVLTLGVCCCLLTSVVLLPAIFAWATRHRREATPDDASPRLPPAVDEWGRRVRRADPPHESAGGLVPRPAAHRPRPHRSRVDPRRL